MSATSLYIVDTLKLRGKRTGVKDVAAGTKKAVKKMVNRSGRVAGKSSLALEMKALEVADLSNFFDVTYQAPSSGELEALADQILAGNTASVEEDEDDAEDFQWIRPLPVELLGSLPDWMLEQMEAANGDSFAYLSLLEQKRPRTAGGVLVEELEAA